MTPSNAFSPVVAQDARHLNILVRQHIEKYTEACDLNHIDVSRVTSMQHLFQSSFFTGDVSRWDTSAVTSMDGLFAGSVFNGDISDWNVSNVRSMAKMFQSSHFRGNLSHWNVGMVQTMEGMFEDGRFNSPIGDWTVGHCLNFSSMFSGSRFNQDIAKWDMRRAQAAVHMFYNSAFAQDVSAWDVPVTCEMMRLFELDSPAMQVQGPADWHAKLYLDNWSLPPPGPMLDAFEELKSIHDGLGSTPGERARDVVRALVAKRRGKEAGPEGGESWALDGLVF